MKRLLIFTLFLTLVSCSSKSKYDHCVESMVDDGYSIEDAQESCDMVRDEDGIQGE